MNALPRHRTVSDVMTSHVHFASPLAPFKVLVRLIEENRVSAIPIVDRQGVPIGIVSETDLLLKERRQELESSSDLLHLKKRRRERAKAAGTVAAEVMTTPPVTVAFDTGLKEAARRMQKKNVRRLVVVDEKGRIAGIVTRSDLLQVFLRSDQELRDEIVGRLIPAVILNQDDAIGVEVNWNIVTLTGEVDRKSDVELLSRMIDELDGVVGVVNRLSHRWDDTDSRSARPTMLDRAIGSR